MKPPVFSYVRAETVEEALAALAEHGDDAKVLAGGQSLVPAMNMRLVRPSALIDINHVLDLGNVSGDVSSANGSIRVGATVRQADRRLLDQPLLAETLPHVGHFVTRNRGTLGGSVAHADPAAELPVCLVALGGSVRARSDRSEREIAASEFFVAPFTTALEPDELVVETLWPKLEPGSGFAFCELAQRGGDFALCIAAAVVRADEIRLALGAVVERPMLVDVDPDDPGRSAAAQVEPWPNVHASAAYLNELVHLLVDRAVARARQRAAA
jgi:2-furoyl-CoA dehydrogenase FAD binding subunit